MSFLTTRGVPRRELEEILDMADEFNEVLARPIPKVPALQGKLVANLFFENSTRTRLSFERATRALSADVMSFSVGASSVSKGESLKDTALTIEALGARPYGGAPQCDRCAGTDRRMDRLPGHQRG